MFATDTQLDVRTCHPPGVHGVVDQCAHTTNIDALERILLENAG